MITSGGRTPKQVRTATATCSHCGHARTKPCSKESPCRARVDQEQGLPYEKCCGCKGTPR